MKQKLRSLLNIPGIVVVLFLLIYMEPGQGQNIDSLKQLAGKEKNHHNKADQFYEIMRAYLQSGNYDSANAYADQLQSLASEIGYREREADALYIRSIICDNKGEITRARELIIQYLEMVRRMNDTSRLGKGNLIYSRVLKDQGYNDSTIYYLRENLEMGKLKPDMMILMATNNDIGNYFQDLNQYDSAIHYYLETARLCEESDMVQYLGNVYNNMGKTFMRLKQYDDAVKYLEMSLEINRERNDKRNVALNLTNLGGVCLETDKLDEALDYYNQAYQIYITFGSELLEIGDILNNVAEVYEQQKKYEKALVNLFRANAIYSKQNYLEGITMSLVNIGNIYTAQARYEEAEAVLDSSLRVALRAESMANQKNILWAMADNYYKAGNYKKAYEYYDQYQEIYKQLYETDRTARINELNIKYNNEKIARENLSLKNDNLEIQLHLKKKTLQSTVFMFTFIGVVLLALLIALYSRHRITVSRNRIRQLEEEKKLVGARLLLEAQEQERKRIALELHDGLGVLLSATRIQFSNLKDKSPENRQLIEKASQLLEQASGDVRKISHNMMPGLLTKLGLYEAVEDLFENLNETDGLRAVFEIIGQPKRLPENVEIMLYRIIQEWVNNTLKHANARNISLRMWPVDKSIEIKYSDDGLGFEPAKVMFADTESLGLKSIQSRVSFLNGKIDIESAPGKGVLYKLTIPVGVT